MNQIHGSTVQQIPNLHALRAFEAAGRLGSFVRASEELRLTPSAISHQIRALEERFARALFVRSNRQVVLTPDGERLLETVSNAFNSIRGICAELDPGTPRQGLAVHCTPSFATKWLGPRLPAFIAREPCINLRLSSSAEPVDLLRRDDLDVVVAYGAPPPSPGITTRSLGREEITALCSPTFARAHHPIRPEDFERVVRLESSLSPVKWADWFALNGIAMTGARAGPSFDRGSLIVAAAVQGLGVALETRCFAEAEVESGALVRFCGDQFQSIWREMHFLCFRTRNRNHCNIQKFCEWILHETNVAKAETNNSLAIKSSVMPTSTA